MAIRPQSAGRTSGLSPGHREQSGWTTPPLAAGYAAGRTNPERPHPLRQAGAALLVHSPATVRCTDLRSTSQWRQALDPMQNKPNRRCVRRGGAENPKQHIASTAPQHVWELYGRVRPPSADRPAWPIRTGEPGAGNCHAQRNETVLLEELFNSAATGRAAVAAQAPPGAAPARRGGCRRAGLPQRAHLV